MHRFYQESILTFVVKYFKDFFSYLSHNMDSELNKTDSLYFRDIIKIEYNLNQFGYRSPEFEKNTNLLVAGCSVTFGVGLPEKYIWGSLLRNQLKVDRYANLSLYGDSIEGSVFKIVKFIKNYGPPQKIVFLAPEPYRYVVIENEEPKTPSLTRSDSNLAKFSKYPHEPSEVLSGKNALYSSFRALTVLEELCRGYGITLIWGTWSAETKELVENCIQDRFDFYYPGLDIDSLHEESLNLYSPESPEEEIIFTAAADRLNSSGHFGTWYHRALSNKFEEILKNENLRN